MSGVVSTALHVDAVVTVARMAEFFGSIGWLVGVVGAVATMVPRLAARPWLVGLIDRVMVIGLVGIAAAFVGALVSRHWAFAVAAVFSYLCCQVVREQVPGRPERRRLTRSISGLLARAGWWLSPDRQAYAAAVVRVERPGAPAGYSLTQIKQEWVGQILKDADDNVRLDRLLDQLAAEIEAAVYGVGRIDARPSSARYRMAVHAKVNDFANSVLAQATEPDAHRTVHPLGYSATMLKLAAACRLADRHAGVPARV